MSFQSLNNSKEKKIEKTEKEFQIGNYLIKNTLGQGTFGRVKLGIYLPTMEKMAIKILEKSKIHDKDDKIRINREFEMLTKFNHINVILVTEIFESYDSYYSVMEYCEGGELFNYIVKKRRLSEEESAFFYYQLINGLEYIHSLNMVHRDLKPENLLLTKEHILKIIDFGLSNYYKDKNKLLSTPCGSPCYASPEMIAGKNYDGFKIDIWSTGIILYAMLCGFLPFEDNDNDQLFKKILECKLEFPKYVKGNSKDLIQKILVTNPKERITIKDIKQHPFYILGKHIFDNNFTIKEFNRNNYNENEIEYIQIDVDKNTIDYDNNNENECNNREKEKNEKDLKLEENINEKIEKDIKKELKNEILKKEKERKEKDENKQIIAFNTEILNNNKKSKNRKIIVDGIRTLNFHKRHHLKQKINNNDFSEQISKTEPNTITQKKMIYQIKTSKKLNNKLVFSPKNKSIIKPIINNSTITSNLNNLSNISDYSNLHSMRIPFSSSLTRKYHRISSKKKPNNITIKNTVYNFNMIVIPSSHHKKSISKPQYLNNSTKLFHMLNKSERKKNHLKEKRDFLNNYYYETIQKTHENYSKKKMQKLNIHNLNYHNYGKSDINLYTISHKRNKINSIKLGDFYKNNLKTNKNSINTINNISINSNGSRHSKIYSYQTTSTSVGKNLFKNNNINYTYNTSKSKSKSKQSTEKKIKNICIKDILKRLRK